MPKLNGWLIALIILAFIVLVASIVVLILTGHDATGFVTLIGILLTTVAGFVGTLNALTKQSAEISTVKSNTNGTLSKLQGQLDDNAAKLSAALAHLTPEAAQNVLATTADAPVIVTPTTGDSGAQTTTAL